MFIAINHTSAAITVPVWTGLSLLGNGWGLLCAIAPLLVIAPRLFYACLCAAPFATLFARAGKSLITSPRPAALIDNAQFTIVGERLDNLSMPSGHTTTAFAIAAALWFALPAARRLRHSWLLCLAAAAGLSRVAVGAHWPGDVAVGACLGLWAGMLGNALLACIVAPSPHSPTPSTASPASPARLASAALVACAVYYQLTDTLDFTENAALQLFFAGLGAVSLCALAVRIAVHYQQRNRSGVSRPR